MVDPQVLGEVQALPQGEHLCLFYDDDPAEQFEVLVPFIHAGLANGERCIYIADDQSTDEVQAALARGGIDVASAIAGDALWLWTREQWRLPGELDSDTKAAQVRGVIAEALASGFSGIRFAVEMTWTLNPAIPADRLRHWEAMINTVFTPDLPARIICQYSRSRLPADVLHAALTTHPTAVLNGELCHNPFYDAPLLLAGSAETVSPPDGTRVDWMVERLRWSRALSREREQRIRAEASLQEAHRLRAQMEALYLDAELARSELAEQASLLATVNELSRTALTELDAQRAVQAVTDSATDAVRAQVGAFFYNVDAAIDPRDTFAGTDGAPIEPFSLLRKSELLAPTLRDGDLVRLGDVRAAALARADERSPGTVPAKLSLRSYLAVPVIGRSAEILGALVFGHAKAGVFVERDERIAAAIAAQAAIAIENARLYEEAQRAIEVREQFLGIASHELRTPLTVLRGYAQLLQRQLRRGSLDPDQLPGVVEHLVQSADRLNRLINELLDTSRLQRGRLELHREPADLASVAALVLERFEDVPERTPAHSLVLDAPAPVVGRWDVGRVDQVLTTVVGNAVKYSPDGGEVRVSVRVLDHHAEITVSDQGIGIDAADHAAVFQPFQRVCEDKRVTSGHGLGLYIAEQIVVRHGGTITLDSALGAGSRFTVTLPIDPIDAEASADDGPRGAASTAQL